MWLLVVFFLIGGEWIQGESQYGWEPVQFTTYIECRSALINEEGINANLVAVNPRLPIMRFECVTL